MTSYYPRSFEAVLFDLDGTVADTAPDLATALNKLLLLHHKAVIDPTIIRNHVSQGSAALVRLGFPEITDNAKFEKLRLQLLDLYQQALYVETRLFSGMEKILTALVQQQLRWGIVTNKPGWLTDPLLKQLLADHKPLCVVSGDTLKQRKPDPEPLLHACKQLNCDPAESIYIGDDPRDVWAGNAAGMYTCIAAYGYIDAATEQLSEWGADFIIQQPVDLFHYVTLHAEPTNLAN